jgi:hypothetical protein
MPNITEIREMALLCQTMNGAGKGDPPVTLETQIPAKFGWALKYEGKDTSTPDLFFGGFHRYGNRWAVYQKANTNTFAIVIRGTVYSTNMQNPMFQRSWIQDALALSTKANNVWFSFKDGIKDGSGHVIELSENIKSTVHIGFAYGLIDILFHKKDADGNSGGLLGVLQKLPDDSEIYITGHSQGAAIATLLHAFLHNRAADKNKYYGLGTKRFKLRSYVFAQPKPGDWQFAMDFSRGLYAGGNDEFAYVINNANDVVPQVPFTIQWLTQGFDQILKDWKPNDADSKSINTLNGLKAAIALSQTFSYSLSKAMVVSQNMQDSIDANIYTKLPEEIKKLQDNLSDLGTIDNLEQVFEKRQKIVEVLTTFGHIKNTLQDIPLTLPADDKNVGFNDLDPDYFKTEPQGGADKSNLFSADSITYMPVGTVIPLPLCNTRKDLPSDPFAEHHLSTYMDLLSDENLKDPEKVNKVKDCIFRALQ